MRLYFAWVIALGGLLLSLFYGEVLDLEPCRLCWYQRMAIFPLAFFLGIASYKHDVKLAFYSLPLAAFGGLVALYQSLSMIFPSLHSDRVCGASYCTEQGFLPILSALGFAAMILLILSAKLAKKEIDSR